MAKLIMLSGLPASGKSTKAREIVGNGNFVRVNRDLLRAMLHFDNFSGRNEGMTVDTEIAIVRNFLHKKQNVVVDDVNINPKNKEMWARVAEECGVTFEHHHIGTHYEECIHRDRERAPGHVGEHVIIQMALQYGFYPVPEKGFVLCDLDGTLCDIGHRLEYASGEKKNWGTFFSKIADDAVRLDTLSLLNDFSNDGYEIILVSARPDTYRQLTEEWLMKHAFTHPSYTGAMYKTLIMRKGHDKRPDTEVKQQMYNTYFKDKYPIRTVIDDRPSVIRMWRENGLNVLDVGNGIEF